MTAKERKSIAEQLYTVQNALDDLLDQIVGKEEPQPEAPAKSTKKKTGNKKA
jgi:hypothetical protein